MNNESKNQSCALDKFESQIVRGRKLLEKSIVTATHIKLWRMPLKRPLETIFGSASPFEKAFNQRVAGTDSNSNKDLLNEQLKFIEQLSCNLKNASNVVAHGTNDGISRVFLGHGRNPVWNRIYTYIKDELHFQIEAFETEPHISSHIVDALSGFLGRCDFAVIVMAGDDFISEGNMRARQNVIHEIGLFQGRYGFERVIVFQEDGIEGFSNISGLQTVRYKENPEQGFYELGRALNKLIGQ
jgi:predicted nucleotide-binding protein